MQQMKALLIMAWLALGHAESDFDHSVNARLAELERKLSEQLDLNAELMAKQAKQETEIKSLSAMESSPRKLQDYSAFFEDLQGAMTHMWLLVCGALVMFMQAGFALVESGCCRAKNAQNILLKNLTDVCVGTLGWWALGYGFAYGGPLNDDGVNPNGFIGTQQFLGWDFLERNDDGTFTPTDQMLAWFFQWAFCSAAATIVSGGVAERVNFPGYVVFSFMMTAFIYPVVVAWTWGYGFLGANNYMDFAGSGIVHMCGGVGALVGAAIVGPRAGRFENPDAFQRHSLPLVVLGTFILWFGWYGFNCGSTLSMESKGSGQWAAFVAMNTTIAAATGGLVVFLLRYMKLKRYDIGGFCNGILAGLVSITAPCANIECGSAFATAFLGGLIYEGASMLLKKLKVDDPVDAFAVHGACGAWGVLAAALFDFGEGFDQYNAWSGFDCNRDDLTTCSTGVWADGFGINVGGIVAIAAWTAFWTALIFTPLRFTGMLRASDEVQEAGFDAQKHSPPKAYVQDADTAGTLEAKASKVHVTPTAIMPA